jgi:hypothetical protein
MEGYTDQRAAETTGVETDAQGCDCVNYYPGMLAEMEEREMERRDREFEQEFFGGSGCFEGAEESGTV